MIEIENFGSLGAGAAPKKKIKVLWISDHPFSNSGVGTQSKNIVEALIASGKFQVVYLAGAIKHLNYSPQKVNEDLLIYPVDGYASKEIIRSIIRTERPDEMFLFTDPRFFTHIFEIENEIRPQMPIIYEHVWDNFPVPRFNKKYYQSVDAIFTISRLTDKIVETLCPDLERHYVGHAVDPKFFKLYPEEEVFEFRKSILGKTGDPNRFMLFWASRNARRKQSGSLIWWFNDFLNLPEVGRDKATLVMHCDPRDPNGQDLVAIMEELDLTHGEVIISNQKVDNKVMALFNNAADCGINISDAGGFELSVLEALQCGTPVIGNMTGGIQDQIRDQQTGEFYGIPLYPSSKAVIGSQDVPWIYEDRLSGDDVTQAMLKMFKMSKEERKELGRKGHEYVMKQFNFQKYTQMIVDALEKIYQERGSWETRKMYKSWTMTEV